MAMVKTAKVSDKGQIAIPLEIREAIGIERGDELVLMEAGGRILIEKAEDFSKKVKDDFSDLLKFSEYALKEIWDNKEDDIWERYLAGKKK